VKSIQPGSRLGPYEILAAVGSGGMGEVYRAYDPRLKRDVAIKVLPPTTIADQEHRQRLEREAQAIAALNHPNIVTIYSVEEAEGVPFLTMEFVDGKPLSELIPRNGMAMEPFLRLAIPIADAIAAAHLGGITHRDLKPTNIMAASDGRVKILDFGLAKLRDPEGPANRLSAFTTEGLTGSGQILGTVAYMSPEQAEGKPVDERSDIFSLGILLYEMATGRRPFHGETAVSILSSIIKDTPAPVTELNRALPPDLGRIIRRALPKDPERRYQTAKDVRNDLEDLREAFASKSLLTQDQAEGAPQKTYFKLLWTVGAVSTIAIAMVLGWTLRGGRPSGVSEARIGEFTVGQITSDPGVEAQPSISPDGKWVVYTKGESNADIYLQGVGGQVPINLTKDSDTSDDYQPAFSPDGERIAFRSDREGGGLFLMGRTGESVLRLTTEGFNPAWSPDGLEIVYAETPVQSPYFRSGSSRLWIVKVANGEKRLLTETDAVQPSWSPHGLRIAYWAVGGSNRLRDIFTIPAGGGPPTAVTNDSAVDANPIWSPDGKHLYFVSDRGGSLNLWRIGIDESSGKPLSTPEPVTTPSLSIFDLTVSSDGKRLAFTSLFSTTNIQKVGFDPMSGQTTGPPAAVTTGTREWRSVGASPDGQWVTLASGPPQEDIYVARSDGSGLRQLTKDPAYDRVPRWSPDGTRIAFHSNRDGVQQIWTIRPDGSELRRLTSYPNQGLRSAVWSPDGTRMAAFDQTAFKIAIFDPRKSWDQQAPEEIPAPLAGKQCVPESWSPDGSKLACVSDSGTIVYFFDTRKYERVIQAGDVVWLSDSRRLLLSDSRILLADALSKKAREILSVLPEYLASPSLPLDNRHIFFVRANAQSDIYMLSFR
jgi:eukaryotic-like serine/threonine-protein kinase